MQGALEAEALARDGVEALVEELPGIAAGGLGPAHGLGGVAQQRLTVGAVGGEDGDADTRRQKDSRSPVSQRRSKAALMRSTARETSLEVGCRPARGGSRPRRCAPRSRRRAGRAAETGDLPFELLGGVVAERVVDVLEAVDPQRQRGKAALLALRDADQAHQMGLELGAAGGSAARRSRRPRRARSRRSRRRALRRSPQSLRCCRCAAARR